MEKEVRFEWEELEDRSIDIYHAGKLAHYSSMSKLVEKMEGVLNELNEVLEKVRSAQKFGIETKVKVTSELSKKIEFGFDGYFLNVLISPNLELIVDDYIQTELSGVGNLDYFHEDGFEYLSAIYEYLYSQKEAQIAYLDEANDYLRVVENGS